MARKAAQEKFKKKEALRRFEIALRGAFGKTKPKAQSRPLKNSKRKAG